mgnify:CR=1 FL=1
MSHATRRLALALLLGGVSAAATAQEPAVADAESADVRRAQAAIADLGQRLRAALVRKMQSEGPVAAVDFCHVEAPVIATAVSQRHGVGIGRTALRHRSPANAPAPWQQRVLQNFLRQSDATPPAQLLHAERDGGTLRVARGIATEAPCLVCHGADIAEPIRAAIAERYPDDAATGFSEGELRGMFWVEVPSGTDEANATDARIAIPLDEAERESLRAEMRVRMETLSRALMALAAEDWETVAATAEAGSKGQPSGIDFRASLPPGWFAMARPMHADFSALAAEARGGRRTDAALKHLADASGHCAACHAAYRTASSP